MAGTRPHFPAVNTWPPSTATASASLRCGAIQSRDECHRVETKNNKLTDFGISSRVYHNLLQAIFNCRGDLAFNGGGVPRHTADAPRVTLGGLSMAHSTPPNGNGCNVRCLLWRGKKDLDISQTDTWLTIVFLPVLLVFFTFFKGMDNAHVVSTQIQEGVCVWGHPHELHCWIFEHQVLGRRVGFRWEKVKALKRQQVKWFIRKAMRLLKHKESEYAEMRCYSVDFLRGQSELGQGSARSSRPAVDPCE